MTSTNVVIVGAGHMGSAIALGLRRSNSFLSITVIESNPIRRNEIITAGIPSLECLSDPLLSDVLILAIPPQTFLEFSKRTPQLEQYPGVIISVMAGINIAELKSRLKNSKICRAIPNLPCAINEGVTALICAPRLSKDNKGLINNLFSTLGTYFHVKDENLIDDATAIIGGGPAYICYFATALIEYAQSVGFESKSAFLMTTKILQGTAALLEINQEPPEKLCQQVMTPKGTTELAINHFDKKHVRATIISGLKQSSRRSKILGGRT
ncbi:pyrroline-5-carboxylate reductase family protein [Pseudomonas palleroniana]|nr:pyrroline-5-carboxylate reductase dimerization domain-containing protein [Pseudomonas palleroniana]SEF03684.1 pyrroline-5-carboxylate reductase [Pseudomonas palleroniana]